MMISLQSTCIIFVHKEFKQHFEPFFIQDDVNSYDNQVTKLASPGFWNADVGDAVPVAVANLFQCDHWMLLYTPACQVKKSSQRSQC